MVGVELLLIAALSAQGCGVAETLSGQCHAAITEGGVDLSAGSSSGGGGGGASGPRPLTWAERYKLECIPEFCRDLYTVTRPITAFDIESFHAAKPALGMDPEGWTIVGLDTAFSGSAVAHEVSGVLLAQPAVVSFTPTALVWDFGDGGSARIASAASSTDHVYDQGGRLMARLTVEYSAQYRWADGVDWVPVQGIVRVASDPMPVWVRSANTVLVPGACTTGSTAPGC